MRNPENFIWISSAPGAHGKFLQTMIFWLANDIVTDRHFFTDTNYHQQGASIQSYTNVGDRGALPWNLITTVKFNDDNSYSTMVFAGGMEHFENRPYASVIRNFSKFKWIVVTMEDYDWLNIDLNHYLKLDHRLYTKFLPNIGHLNFNDPNIATGIIKKCYEIPNFTDQHKKFSLDSYLKAVDKLSQKHKDIFDHLEYRDILLNPEYVMSKMSEWTNKPINDFIRTKYQQYLEAQKKFLLKINPTHFLVA